MSFSLSNSPYSLHHPLIFGSRKKQKGRTFQPGPLVSCFRTLAVIASPLHRRPTLATGPLHGKAVYLNSFNASASCFSVSAMPSMASSKQANVLGSPS